MDFEVGNVYKTTGDDAIATITKTNQGGIYPIYAHLKGLHLDTELAYTTDGKLARTDMERLNQWDLTKKIFPLQEIKCPPPPPRRIKNAPPPPQKMRPFKPMFDLTQKFPQPQIKHHVEYIEAIIRRVSNGDINMALAISHILHERAKATYFTVAFPQH